MNIGPLYIAPFRCWKSPNVMRKFWGTFYRFSGRPGLMPGRWGFGICGLIEFGSRERLSQQQDCWRMSKIHDPTEFDLPELEMMDRDLDEGDR